MVTVKHLLEFLVAHDVPVTSEVAVLSDRSSNANSIDMEAIEVIGFYVTAEGTLCIEIS